MPFVSIIIITYNREKFIKYAIDSVLTQTHQNFELIILDVFSNDNTENLVKEYLKDERIKYFKSSKKEGIAISRNKAINYCNGKYIAILDSDDLWCDNKKLEKQINFLEKNNDFALVGTNAIFINEIGKEIRKSNVKLNDKKIRNSILLRNQFFHSSVVFNRNIFLELNKYDENLKIGEDYDLFLRIGKKYKFANLNDYSILYRVHNSSICITDRISAAKYTQNIIKKYRNDYPNFLFAFIKSYLRILLAYYSKLMTKN